VLSTDAGRQLLSKVFGEVEFLRSFVLIDTCTMLSKCQFFDGVKAGFSYPTIIWICISRIKKKKPGEQSVMVAPISGLTRLRQGDQKVRVILGYFVY